MEGEARKVLFAERSSGRDALGIIRENMATAANDTAKRGKGNNRELRRKEGEGYNLPGQALDVELLPQMKIQLRLPNPVPRPPSNPLRPNI